MRLPTDEAHSATEAVSESPSTPVLGSQNIRATEEAGYHTDSTTDTEFESALSDGRKLAIGEAAAAAASSDTVKVVRLAWLEDSLARGRVVDYREYLVFEAVKAKVEVEVPSARDIMQRALDVAATSSNPPASADRESRNPGHGSQKAPSLLTHETTEENAMANLPPLPESMKTKYACQRATCLHPPNEEFIQQLKDVRELRAMSGDVDGARAYAEAIASLSAYPYKLQSQLGKRNKTTVLENDVADLENRDSTLTGLRRQDSLAFWRVHHARPVE